MIVRLPPYAEADMEEGAEFYERQSSGLGSYFNECLSRDIDELETYAGIHELRHGLHCSLSRKFPFAIYYRLEDDVVNVVAVIDSRRKPSPIERKLRDRE